MTDAAEIRHERDTDLPPSDCATCLNVGNASGYWKYWQCLKFRRPAEFNAIRGEVIADPPHYLCRDINGFGQCKYYLPNPAGSALNKRRSTDENQ